MKNLAFWKLRGLVEIYRPSLLNVKYNGLFLYCPFSVLYKPPVESYNGLVDLFLVL